MDKQVLKNRIERAFYEVFPKSHISITNAPLSGRELYIKCYLQTPDQWANGISHNDPLSYMADIDPITMVYSEHHHHMYIKPQEKYLAYSSVSIRKRTIKNADIPKIKKRFEQLRDFIRSNLDQAAHNITDKVA